MLAIAHTPPSKRPRERILHEGASGLSMSELVALLLGSGVREREVGMVSEAVATSLESGECTASHLLAITGIGPAKASLLLAACALGERLSDRVPSLPVASPSVIFQACRDLLRLPQEHLVAFSLNARGQAYRRDTVTIGTLTASLIHPREVFRVAITNNASSIVLAHNHPSGDCSPSDADCEATRLIARAGSHLGIGLADHVVCSSTGFTSLKMAQPHLF